MKIKYELIDLPGGWVDRRINIKSGEIAVYARKDLKLIQSTYTGRVYYAGVA